MDEVVKQEIELLFDKPIKDWPQTLQNTYWAMPSWVRSDLQTVADLIEVWINHDRRELTEAEVFPNHGEGYPKDNEDEDEDDWGEP